MAKAKAALNPKQRRFTLAILEGADSTEAARKAGYSDPNYGRQLITNPNVRAAVQQGQCEIAQRAGITQDFLVEQTLKILEFALAPVPTKDRYGNPTGTLMRQLGAANTAVFNLAKLCGLWVDRGATAPPSLAAELFEAIGANPMTLIEQDPDDEAKE